MIALRLAKQFFVKLYWNAVVTIQYTSLFFKEEPEQGNYVAGLTFPALDTNSSNLKNHHAEHAVTSPDNFTRTAEIFKDTYLVDSGTYEFGELTDEEYSLNIYLGIDSLPVMKKKLSELDLGGNRTIGATSQDVIDHAKAKNALMYPSTDYVFPVVKNQIFYPPEKNPYWFGVINRWDPVSQEFHLNALQVGHAENRDSLVPYPFVKYILKQMFAETPFALGGDFMNDTETDQFILENNFALDDFGDQHYKIFVSSAPGYYELASEFIPMPVESGGTYYDDDDAWFAGGNYYNICASGPHEIIFDMLFTAHDTPGVDAVDASIRVDLMFDDGVNTPVSMASQEYPVGSMTDGSQYPINLSITPDFNPEDIGGRVYAQSTVVGLISLDSATLKITPQGNSASLNEYAKIINLTNHVPDMTCGEFLIRLISSYGFAPEYHKPTQTVELNYKSSKTPDTAKDYTHQAFKRYQKQIDKTNSKKPEYEFPSDDNACAAARYLYDPLTITTCPTRSDLPTATSPQQLVLVLNSMTIYESYYEPSLPGYLYKEVGNPFIHDTDPDLEANDLFAHATPLMMQQTKMEGGGWYPTLWMDQEGTSTAYELGPQNNTEVRIAIWRGMQNFNGNDFPFASNHQYDIEGTLVYDLSLDFKGDEGLMLHCWGDWILWLNSGLKWIRKFTFSLMDLLNYDIYRPMRIQQKYFMASQATATIENRKDEIEMEIEYIEMVKEPTCIILFGPNVIPNPDFADGDDGGYFQDQIGDWVIDNTGAQHTGGSNPGSILREFPPVESPLLVAKWKIEIVVTGHTQGTYQGQFGGGGTGIVRGPGAPASEIVGPIAGIESQFFVYVDADFDGKVVSWKLYPQLNNCP